MQSKDPIDFHGSYIEAVEHLRQTSVLKCAGCDLAYADPAWMDCFIPNDIWARISPSGDEGGVLCITCIARRLLKLGIENVPMQITSGPFIHPDTIRLDWLDDRDNYWSVTPATNMIGIPKGWTYRLPGQSLDAIGERCLDVREAIDKVMRVTK